MPRTNPLATTYRSTIAADEELRFCRRSGGGVAGPCVRRDRDARDEAGQQILLGAAESLGAVTSRDLVLAMAVSYWREGTTSKPWNRHEVVPLEQFRRSTIKRHNPETVRQNTGDAYRGCLCITVLQSRALYEVMHGLVQGLVSQPRSIEEWHDEGEAPAEPQDGADLPSALV